MTKLSKQFQRSEMHLLSALDMTMWHSRRLLEQLNNEPLNPQLRKTKNAELQRIRERAKKSYNKYAPTINTYRALHKDFPNFRAGGKQ